jgi:hypothetical protein
MLTDFIWPQFWNKASDDVSDAKINKDSFKLCLDIMDYPLAVLVEPDACLLLSEQFL